jgi:hypothetical protein
MGYMNIRAKEEDDLMAAVGFNGKKIASGQHYHH